MPSTVVARARKVASHLTTPADVALAARVLVWAMALPILKVGLRIERLVTLLHATHRHPVRDRARERRVVDFARWACQLTRPGRGGNCLERGLIAYRYLGAGGAQPTLVVGMRRDASTGVAAHAWVMVEGLPVTDTTESLRAFVPLMEFDPDGTLHRPAGARRAI